MTTISPLELRRELQDKCKKLRPRLSRLKKTRELARRINVHPNSLALYLDGFCQDNELMERILAEGSKLIAGN